MHYGTFNTVYIYIYIYIYTRNGRIVSKWNSTQIYNLTICSYIHQAIPALPAFLRSRKERPSNKRNQPLLANVTVDWINVLYFVGFSCMLVLIVSNGPVIAVAKKAAKLPKQSSQQLMLMPSSYSEILVIVCYLRLRSLCEKA